MKNSLFKKEHVEQIAQERMKICNACEHIDRDGSTCFVLGTQPCCRICGCKLAWKTRALSEGCDDKRWKPLVDYEDEVKINNDLGIDNEH